ncbi:MAG TPA: hypothetical protein VMU05_08045 [Dongiaceae bacterium]|nr:hypothetical protein [Dongiaceae bacterium]
MNRSVSSQASIGFSLFLGMMQLQRISPVPRIGAPRVMPNAALLVIAFALCTVRPAWSQEHEVPQAEIMGGYSYLRSSDTNFNGWKATLVGNVNSWLGIAADFDGDYAGGRSEHSVTFGPHFTLRKNERWTPVGYALFGVAFEKSVFGETDHGFSTELGGGLDYEVSHRWTARVFDVTASITHVGGETHVSPKFGVGLIFNIGRK